MFRHLMAGPGALPDVMPAARPAAAADVHTPGNVHMSVKKRLKLECFSESAIAENIAEKVSRRA